VQNSSSVSQRAARSTADRRAPTVTPKSCGDKVASPPPPLNESRFWQSIGADWRPLFSTFREAGFTFEWHDLKPEKDIDWAASFHANSLEICLNLAGTGWVQDKTKRIAVDPRTVAFYTLRNRPLKAGRTAGQTHQFLTVEFSPEFLARHFSATTPGLHHTVKQFLFEPRSDSEVGSVETIRATLLPLIESLRHPPVYAPAQAMWFQSKALEIAAYVLFRPEGEELFCTRQQLLAQERAGKVRQLLRENLAEPPNLEELGRKVGCSPFYLSRIFSQENGMTIQQYLRQIRMERAAELLRSGECNVTEAALEVGYNSLSHFSLTFHQTFGCCPGLFPLRTSSQKEQA
jgi:AraC-like DNA-binding protein